MPYNITTPTIRVGDMVRTPHATRGRLYEVMALGSYRNGTSLANIREIGTPNAATTYPLDLLTFQGKF